MLNPNELETVFPAAKEAGFEDVEIYCENTQSVSVRFYGRTDDVRFLNRRGTSLRASRNGVAQHIYSNSTDARALISALQGGRPTLNALSSDPTDPKATATLAEAAAALLQIFRSAFASQSERLGGLEILGSFSRKSYQVAREDLAPNQGSEEVGELRAEWSVDGTLFVWERARGSISGLLAEVADGLATAVKKSLTPVTRWPAPQGSLPILWSARSVAKIQMLFLKAFEGDLVLGNRSFLTELALPRDLAFTLEDRPPHSGKEVDHEGSALKHLVLWRDGRPTALACNKRVAGQLEVAPTGHGRRESFESPATLGFWHSHLEGKNPRDSLLAEMARGISVREMEVVSFDPASGELALRLLDSRLVHHGAEGEPIEPVILQLCLMDLLASFDCFEITRVTTGLATSKQNQRLYTELTAPAALSKPLPLPGSVPLNHYW